MTFFSFPYSLSPAGTTATVDRDGQIRDMVEQVLFTRRGERVNRPDFGTELSSMLFSENAPEIAAAVQHMVQAALQQWLSEAIQVRSVRAEAIDSLLRVSVVYSRLGEEEQRNIIVEGAV
ncbi:MAG: GPW/gp25 family protein [Pseudomonadota bacterium]